MTESNGDIHAPGALHRKWLFWACFVSLVATSFGFIIRAFLMDTWAGEFSLSQTQKGEIFAAGLWPFAISIILFSLIIDRIGYGKAMVFAFACHVGSALITIFAPNHMDPYWALYLGQFVVALANGTVEAVINPVVATMFPKAKTKWLAILHAGWPGGLMLGGLMLMAMDEYAPADYATWAWKVSLIFIPTAIYGVMMLRQKFPQQERVTAGASYRDMCKEAGVLGMFIATFLIVAELTRIGSQMYGSVTGGDQSLYQVWGWGTWTIHGVNAAISIAMLIPFAVYVRGTIGNALFIVILLLMLPLASTELSTDSWMPSLMKPTMKELFGIGGGWVLIYSAAVMMVLRFFAGPLVKPLGPVGLLAVSSAAAAAGLALLSVVGSAAMILVVVTLYAIGQTFFWPCMLGVVSERLPRGGALTINTVGGVGMLGAGLLGAVLIGNVLDREADQQLLARQPALHAQVVSADEKFSMFGPYRPIDGDQLHALPAEQATLIEGIESDAKKTALWKIAMVPAATFLGFVALVLWFRSRGGYEPQDIAHGKIATE